MSETKINLENVEWYTDTDFAYTEAGVDEAKVYRTAIKNNNLCYEITVYPLKLLDKNIGGWDYRIATVTENGRIIKEYDAGAENYDHFPTAKKAKNASLITLKEMLEE